MHFKDTDKRYNQYSRHLKEVFNSKVYKITLDAGFNCPNRDGTISTGGCIFCDDSGSFSQAHDNLLSIENQLEKGMSFLSKRFKAQKFISYFQAYSNTYAPVKTLKAIYDEALGHNDIVGLSIGTRPDCVDQEKIDLIGSYAKDKYVWVEYGLQSIHNKTLDIINRGHDVECFYNAHKMSKEQGINVCAHVILGLPNENRQDMLDTAKKLADMNIDGVKIHLLCALKNTELERIYNRGEYQPLEEMEYVNLVCDFLELLPPETTIHRLAGNGLKSILVAPRWLPKKMDVLNKIDNELIRRDSWQGKKC